MKSAKEYILVSDLTKTSARSPVLQDGEESGKLHLTFAFNYPKM